MSKAIIPEILRSPKVQRENNTPNYNFNLTQNVDKRNIYDTHNTYNSISNNTTVNKSNKGFLRFLIEIIFLPITLIYKLLKHFFIKYDLYEKLKLEKKRIKAYNFMKKFMKKNEDIYDLDEVM